MRYLILLFLLVSCTPKIIFVTGGVQENNVIEGIYKGKYFIAENGHNGWGYKYSIGYQASGMIILKSQIIWIEK